jgi:predicted dehydrogenase
LTRETKLRVGIAGYGVVGRRRKTCIYRNPNMKLVAVSDRSFGRDMDVLEGVSCFQDYRDLLDQQLDVLFVCMTNDVAAEATIAGLEAGLHVFCEKPPGRDLHEIHRVIRTERKHPSLKLMYGFNHRLHLSVKEALSIFRSGELGSLVNIRGMYGKAKLVTFDQPDWRTKREICGGGILLDQGIHIVDLIRLFGGDFTDVHSFISNKHWGYEVEDNAYALMRTRDGVVAMLNSSATQWRHRFHLDITLERGSLILSGILSGTKSYGPETLTVVRADPEKDRGDPVEQVTRFNHDPSWDEEISIFTDSIINNTKVPSGTSEDALKAMELIFRIYHSDVEWRNKFGISIPSFNG